jgi:hypothetical protein
MDKPSCALKKNGRKAANLDRATLNQLEVVFPAIGSLARRERGLPPLKRFHSFLARFRALLKVAFS